jgi:type IV secretion system protein VirB11
MSVFGTTSLELMLAPISAPLVDPLVTEIVCHRPHEVGVEQQGTWHWIDVPEFTFDRLDAIAILAGFALSKEFSPDEPICLTTLPGGQRFTACRPPVTATGLISFTIRVPSRVTSRVADDDFRSLLREANGGQSRHAQTDAELIRLYREKDWQAFFTLAVQARKTIGVTGRVGSGKTHVTRRLLREIPAHERIVTIEDTDEFGLTEHRNRVSLFFGSAGVTAQQCAETSLRMRPDRVALQEIRGTEAWAFLRVLASGHGGLTTWHSEMGADAAFSALAKMARSSDEASTYSDSELQQIFRGLIDVVAWCSRDSQGFSIPYVWFRTAEEA